MNFNVTIDSRYETLCERDKDGVWIVEFPSIRGCVSQCQTKKEALLDLQAAIALDF
ncbi:type II toxin-antitoxin system HicB family antitoxin [Chamaesiphon sp. VAR_48_metabat_135_sub]|uniref:type II toxin-antitoxin system HicB family antitoxin n=1 Tax=Chamaesiphon sp. VAR_48_metabat_135_sub TaxID=2964699 RepID=UPI00286B7352|nr:type II toxin-antitoxin system HicB family antitoxin [Chamaesiphon sp. VAR_48_metabat_135_sub]